MKNTRAEGRERLGNGGASGRWGRYTFSTTDGTAAGAVIVMLTLAIVLDTLTSPASHAGTYGRRAAVWSRPVRPWDAHCWEYSTHVPSEPARPGTCVPRLAC